MNESKARQGLPALPLQRGLFFYHLLNRKMNKKQLTERCRLILRSHDYNEQITNQEFFAFLLDLFSCHSEWELKQGAGIQSITVKKDHYGNKYFYLNRIDGTGTDISFVHSITNRKPIQVIKNACRTAIKKEVERYRIDIVQYGISKCAVTGEVLTQQNTHIDHYDLTFDDMFKLWIADKSIDELVKLINKTEDNSLVTKFTCQKTTEEFIAFHNHNCKLRAVSRIANLSIIKKL
jgi:hypothetical protein